MSKESEGTLVISFEGERLARLRNAKELFKSDTGEDISMDDFVDMLVKTYMSYREKRGGIESSLLRKLTQR